MPFPISSDDERVKDTLNFHADRGIWSDQETIQGLFLERAKTPSSAEDAKTCNVSELTAPTPSASDGPRVYPHHSLHQDGSPNEHSPLLSRLQLTPKSANTMGPSSRYEYRRVGDDTRDVDSPEVEERIGSNLYSGKTMSNSRTRPIDNSDDDGLYEVSDKVRSWRRWAQMRSVRIVAGGLLAIIAIGLLVALFAAPEQDLHTSLEPEPEPAQAMPTQVQAIVGSEAYAPWPIYCGSQSQLSSEVVRDFGEDNFQFSENLVGYETTFLEIFGDTHFRAAPANQNAAISVNTTIVTSSTIEIQNIQSVETASGLGIQAVDFSPPQTGSTNCMYIHTNVYMKSGLTLESLDINSRNTKVEIHEGIDLTVQGLTNITLESGVLSSRHFTSRETDVTLNAGSITGEYSLLDRLALKTRGGSIKVDVIPGQIDPKRPKPASFSATSFAGSIKVYYDISDLPERDYQTDVMASMGSVKGKYVHGSRTKFETLAGSVKIDVFPYNASETSTLSTSSMSGSTKVDLHPPLKNPGTPITALRSTHDGKSGSIKLNYPQEWEGKLDGATQSGSLDVSGKDVRVIREGGAVGHFVTAEKGDGNSALKFNTMSGSCKVRIGDA